MKSHLVADGRQRLIGSHEHQDRLRELMREIEARHAAEFSQAGWLDRWRLRRRIAREFRRARQTLEPSARACYLAK